MARIKSTKKVTKKDEVRVANKIEVRFAKSKKLVKVKFMLGG